MKIILIVTNLCTVFPLVLAQQHNVFFVTLSTVSSDVPAKFGKSLTYYKKSIGTDPLQELADEHKLKLCTKIFNSQFFINNDDYEEYKNILKKIQAAVQKYPITSQGLTKQIFIKHESFQLITLSFVYLCFSDDSMELYISTDFTNVNSFFLYSYIRGSSNMSKSTGVTLLAYAETNPVLDSRTNYGLEMLYFTQRNVFDENNNFIQREPEPWSPSQLRLCAAGYAYTTRNVNLKIQICKVEHSDVHTKSIEITAVKPTRYYELPVMRCHVHCMDTNKIMDYYFSPDLEDNSSVFYLLIKGNFFKIAGRMSGVP